MFKKVKLALFAVTVTLVSACGGGSSDNGHSSVYPLRQAYINDLLKPSTYDFSISGTLKINNPYFTDPITGSGRVSFSPLVDGIFQGQQVQQRSTTISADITILGVTEHKTGTKTDYFDLNYDLLGSVESTTNLLVKSRTSLPETVTIGQSGVFYTANKYGDTTLTTQVGTRTVNYSVEADSIPNSALISFNAIDYDLTGMAIDHATQVFRLSVDGVLTPISETATETNDRGSISATFTYH